MSVKVVTVLIQIKLIFTTKIALSLVLEVGNLLTN